jgi:hypothetical protein
MSVLELSLTRIPKFEVLERCRGLVAQGYQVLPISQFGLTGLGSWAMPKTP